MFMLKLSSPKTFPFILFYFISDDKPIMLNSILVEQPLGKKISKSYSKLMQEVELQDWKSYIDILFLWSTIVSCIGVLFIF